MTKQKIKELPQILVLKRAYSMRFPNGQNVGLYHCDTLNQFITIPLDDSKFSSTTESVIEQLSQISESDETKTIIFNDLSELNINKECADIILNFSESHEELLENICHSDKSFLTLLEQAIQIKEFVTDPTEEYEQQQELNDNEIVK